MVKKYWYVIVAVLLSGGLFPTSIPAGGMVSPVTEGDHFPRISLPPFSDEGSLRYLGVEKDRHFTLSDIKADLVLVEIMNTNCISCKKQAPVFNELYSLIAADEQARSRIKMLAIAVGNSDREIKSFKERFQVPYPIVGDSQFLVWDATGRSKTPFSLYVRLDVREETGLVVGTHLGLQAGAKAVFDELLMLVKKAPSAFLTPGADNEKSVPHIPGPVFSRQRLLELMVMSFFKAGVISKSIETVTLKQNGEVYTSIGMRNGETVRLFVKPVHRSLPCDACHSAQFLYIFEANGKIIDLVPLQLSKYGNQPFTEKDLSKIRDRFVGRYIFDAFAFDPALDAVSAATITSSVINKTFNDGKALYEELKEEGLISF